MNKLLQSLGLMVALATTSMLAGCELYFGSHDHNGGSGTWNYCGTDGYYQCHGDSCTWVSPTCPAPGQGSGYECTTSTDCAAGCYCASGTCEEGGFCATDSDCGPGYHCNTDRSSCEPNGGSGSGSGSGSGGPTSCDYDNQCPTGQYCEYDHVCVATCVCSNDTQAQQQGWGWCDETRMTCLPGQDPNGTCGGTATGSCQTLEPRCPTGQVPLLLDGCWTGTCRAYAQCDVPPVCANINDEMDCLGRTDCGAVYTGTNCHKSDGSACHPGDTGCTCSSYTFASCAAKN